MTAAAKGDPTAHLCTEDLQLHGEVGIRLVDAPEGLCERLCGQLAPLERGVAPSADLVIRFVDRIETGRTLHTIGQDEAWFDEEIFLLGLPGSDGRAAIPMDRIGGPCEITCERSLPTVPLLRSIVLLTALARGLAPVHASAVEGGRGGILTTGWTSGGKTGAMLGMMMQGCHFVSDDAVLLNRSGTLLGLQERISIKDHYAIEAAAIMQRMPSRDRFRMRSVGALERLARAIPLAQQLVSPRNRRRLAKRALAARTAKITPEKLFGLDRMCPGTTLSAVVLVESTDGPATSLSPAAGTEIALRAAAASRAEMTKLDEAYRKFRFAFPRKRNSRLEEAEQQLANVLTEALEGVPAYRLMHPRPASVRELARVLRPLCVPAP